MMVFFFYSQASIRPLYSHSKITSKCFHFLAIMNGAAMNIQALGGCTFSFLMDTYLGVELLSHMITIYLAF